MTSPANSSTNAGATTPDHSNRRHPSQQSARAFFQSKVLPRRVHDTALELKHLTKTGFHKSFYRRAAFDAEDESSAEPYPVCRAGIMTFSHFGIGIGVYFMQLIVLSITCLIGGVLLIVAMLEFGKPSYGISRSIHPLIPFSAACESAVDVSATGGCDGSATECPASFRPDCELPYMVSMADLAMSIVMMVAIAVSKVLENSIVEELDEAVQTTQDYSVCVNNPDEDADDPDEWAELFGQFGKVIYVTVTRRNSQLTRLICKRHSYSKMLLESPPTSPAEEKRISRKMDKAQRRLDEAAKHYYPACRIYVTFQLESEQRRCKQAMEVPDIMAMLNLKRDVLPEHMHRGVNVLDVVEPPEPEAILWENVEMRRNKKNFFELLTKIATLALLVACFFLVALSSTSSLLLAVVIAAADSLLPFVVQLLTDLSSPYSEGSRQTTLQVRLFMARLLLSTLFPFVQTRWNSFLDSSFIEQVISVQVAACFVTPIISLTDVAGLLQRHLVAPLFSTTQGQLNLMWTGSDWQLAERYTVIAKMLFVSLFYTLLSPFALFIVTVAFVFMFFVDRYLLLRRWKPSCMLNADIAKKLRQQCILAVCLHMIASLRFIYSWPMDSVFVEDDGSYTKIDKSPPLAFWTYQAETWMGQGQQDTIRMYRITTVLVTVITLYIWLLNPIKNLLFRLFCYEYEETGDASETKFTSVKTPCYAPTATFEYEKYLCSFVDGMHPAHRPQLLRPTQGDTDDLSRYISEIDQKRILSIVKYYGEKPDLESQVVPETKLEPESKLEPGLKPEPEPMPEPESEAEQAVPMTPEEKKKKRVKRTRFSSRRMLLPPIEVAPQPGPDLSPSGKKRRVPGKLNRILLKPIRQPLYVELPSQRASPRAEEPQDESHQLDV